MTIKQSVELSQEITKLKSDLRMWVVLNIKNKLMDLGFSAPLQGLPDSYIKNYSKNFILQVVVKSIGYTEAFMGSLFF